MNEAAHKLTVWLVANEVSKVDFANRVGVKYWTLARWLNGKRLPSLTEAVAIENSTGGEIKTKDWTIPRPLRVRVEETAFPVFQ